MRNEVSLILHMQSVSSTKNKGNSRFESLLPAENVGTKQIKDSVLTLHVLLKILGSSTQITIVWTESFLPATLGPIFDDLNSWDQRKQGH